MVVKVVGIDGNRVTIETPYTDVFNKSEVDITVGQVKQKRSLNANAYFHLLVGKMADKLNISKQAVKNTMITRYGQYEIEDGEQIVIRALSSIDMLNREDIHCSPIGHGNHNGKEVTYYAIMKPSHEMDTYEFAKLLDGCIQECKDLGIEVLSPAEIERMVKAWKPTTQS